MTATTTCTAIIDWARAPEAAAISRDRGKIAALKFIRTHRGCDLEEARSILGLVTALHGADGRPTTRHLDRRAAK